MKTEVVESFFIKLQLHRTKGGPHNGRFLVNFYEFFQDSFLAELYRMAVSKSEISEHWCLHFSPFKKTLHRRII